MKKAFAWCEANHIRYEFHDYKKQGVPRDKLVLWCRTAGLADAGQQQGPDLAQAHARTAGDHHAKRRRGADDGLFQRDPPPHRRKRFRADPGRLRPHPVRFLRQVMDAVHRFLLEDLDIRGALVQLGPSWAEMTATRDYAAPVRELLGELAAVTAIIGSNLKTPGRIGFQMSGHGPVSMLVMDCNEKLQLRGMARSSLS
jgi:hypothetical protein